MELDLEMTQRFVPMTPLHDHRFKLRQFVTHHYLARKLKGQQLVLDEVEIVHVELSTVDIVRECRYHDICDGVDDFEEHLEHSETMTSEVSR